MRGRRWPLRLAAFALTGSVLFAAYWFNRPPELVWWRSPDIDHSGHHVTILIPRGWQIEQPIDVGRETEGEWSALYSFPYQDNRPSFIRRLFPHGPETAKLELVVSHSRTEKAWHEVSGSEIKDTNGPGQERTIERHKTLRSAGLWASVYYSRSNRAAFNRTYKQICDSLTIE